MATMPQIMNYILANGSEEYQNVVPPATVSNIAAVAAPILTYSAVQNEFLTALINRIGLEVVHNKTLKNPLAILKSGSVPLGSDVQEIFINPAAGSTFDPTGAGLLTVTKPDVATLYHRLNRKDEFPVTISREQLAAAFTSWQSLENLMTGIINSLYSGDNYSEFILMKNTLAEGVIDGLITPVTVTAISDTATAKAFVKAVKNAVAAFQFPSSNFNKYQAIKGSGNPIVTWTPKDDQILIIRADIMTEINVEVLAAAFNVGKAEMLNRIVEVDSFGAASPVYGILADKGLLKVYDNLSELTSWQNPKGLYWNYFWHHWQTYSLSLFANAVAFRIADTAITGFDALDSISGNSYANAAAVIAALQALHPSCYVNSGGMLVPITTWVDTDTFNGGANASYTFTGTVGTLPYGWTNAGNHKPTIEVVVDDN